MKSSPSSDVSGISDARILAEGKIDSPGQVCSEIAPSKEVQQNILGYRRDIENIITGKDDRLLVLMGPCSVHDTNAGLEFCNRLVEEAAQYNSHLYVAMRCYFEKPRTRIGWKGLINDPELDGSFNVNDGIRRARQFLLDVANCGIAAGSELLDLNTPQYIADLLSWGCIGARTCESQLHRELASAMSCPVGFKNPTSGDYRKAVDSLLSAREKHIFIGPSHSTGNMSVFTSQGNDYCHVVLRGGPKPNYDRDSIEHVVAMLQDAGLPPAVMVDVSHSNSGKDHRVQPVIVEELARQLRDGVRGLIGVMTESFLVEGNQSITNRPLRYGMSVTDACMGWEMTRHCLSVLAEAKAKAKTTA